MRGAGQGDALAAKAPAAMDRPDAGLRQALSYW